ncbi:FMN-binding protein [Actinokineospora sp. NBRC 105648]|uniref:FMN-binding protein n=1 Tax=Actinokineospora sp. NBRC 105648 TaxID=3032206 RepID=UPI0024A4FAF5|nr:FMN-binding protein [Actinokineospora sp. NBRC 105648]GLZ36693.1 FMN-binding protein [Actinokineospora sp. NBRC 105648]
MRRIALVFAATVSAVVLLFSYRTSTRPDALAAAGTRQRVPVGTAVPNPAPGAASPGTTAPPGTPGAGVSGTYDGGAVDTRYGPVQVRITLSGGRITSAQALRVPSESRRDVQINNAAVPVLVRETLQAQSAGIDTVSGATYTSEGYIGSLQSAIDAAHR